MRTNLKRNQAQSIEGWRLNNRHVFGCLDGWTSDIRAGTRPDVGHAFCYSPSDCLQNIRVVERLQQSKSITAANEDCLCTVHGSWCISCCVDRLQTVTHLLKTVTRRCG